MNYGQKICARLRAPICLLLCLALIASLANCQKPPTTEEIIKKTLAEFESDFNECLDFSAFINGRSLYLD